MNLWSWARNSLRTFSGQEFYSIMFGMKVEFMNVTRVFRWFFPKSRIKILSSLSTELTKFFEKL